MNDPATHVCPEDEVKASVIKMFRAGVPRIAVLAMVLLSFTTVVSHVQDWSLVVMLSLLQVFGLDYCMLPGS